MRKLSYFVLLTILASLSWVVISSNNVKSLSIDQSCSKVELIFARGSGQTVNQENAEAFSFFDQVRKRISAEALSTATYELGTEPYNGSQYPAIAVGGWSFLTGIGAKLSAGTLFSYGDSVNAGVNELQTYLIRRYAKCKSTGTRYILGGYSQGAQVIGEALPGLPDHIRNDIVFVGFFGDPKLHYPEGKGWNPPACQGTWYSAWRRAASNCDLDSGSLGSRSPYLPSDMEHKTGLWCYPWDMICDPVFTPDTKGHLEYKNNGRAIDSAAREAVEKLKERLKKDNPPPQPSPTQPIPPPSIDYDKVLNVRHLTKEGTTGENIVFAVDVSNDMKSEIPAIEQHLREIIPKIITDGGKVSVAAYIGIEDSNGNVVDNTGVVLPFNLTAQQLLDNLTTLLHPNGQPPPGSSLITLNTLFDRLNWENGATKSVTLFTNNPLVDPDFVGLTVDEIAKKSLAIDPVNIYPVVPETARQSYTELATKTSGQVVSYTDNVLEAAQQAYNKIASRPVPFLTNTEYKAKPGQEITFSAAGSYALDAAITTYDWDYDGNGQFEASTATPSIKHAYPTPFSGYMQVRVTATNGTVANTSAKVTVGVTTPPTLPAGPKNLSYTVANTVDDKSSLTLKWEATSSRVEAWLVRINDMPMGYVEASRTSLEITDVERASDTVISIAGAVMTGNKINMSEFSSITVPTTKTPPPPIISTCSQSNFFIQFICKAIAYFKVYIQGFWYYILPYTL